MLDRLLGLETEYAIRYSGAGPRPNDGQIFDAVVESLGQRVAMRDGARKWGNRQRFLENGGAIYYESIPTSGATGLIEASTPECRGPSQAVLYQRTQQRLLIDSLPGARRILAEQGFHGDVGLLKNGRDVEGNVYGPQENYEVEIAGGLWLGLYRLGMAIVVPIAVVTGGLMLCLSLLAFVLVIVPMFAVMLALGLWTVLVPRHEAALDWLVERGDATIDRIVAIMQAVGRVVMFPGVALHSLLFRLCCCRRIRRDALAFLISRPVLTGTGTLDPHTGAFTLSEKGPAITAVVRTRVATAARAVFDLGNVLKQLYCITDLRLRPLAGLFRRRQRLQLGLSDSNCAQRAEYLKLATTCLVFDMAEAGVLRQLPRVPHPIAALHRLIADATLATTVSCSDGVERTGVELQRLYLDAARRFVVESETPSIEAREVIDAWTETLHALEHDRNRAFGHVDWVTKRALIRTAGEGLGTAARKKIDLKYHELGVGHLATLEAEGLVPVLVGDAEIELAVHTPPADTPARRRSQLIREYAAQDVDAVIDWSCVRVPKGFIRSEVIWLDDARR